MAEQLDRLKTALSDRYAIHEELGEGGMATVYLAEDLKHHRKMAVTEQWYESSRTRHASYRRLPGHPHPTGWTPPAP